MSRPFDKRPAGDDDGAERCAEAFTEAHGDAVEAGAVFLQTPRSCRDGLPQPRAVEVHVYRWISRARPLGDLLAVFQGQDGAGEGVFEGDEARGAVVDVC